MPDPRLLAMIRKLAVTVEEHHRELVAMSVEQDDEIEDVRKEMRTHGKGLEEQREQLEDLSRRLSRLEKRDDARRKSSPKR